MSRGAIEHHESLLDVLFELFNARHTSPEKVVSHKTGRERADFLRRFFRDLQCKAGFKTPPDPRNLGDRHIRAMVAVWQCEQLAPATIHSYPSFLRGLASWLGEPGFIRDPAHYGLSLTEYQRHEHARRDKIWTAAGSDIEADRRLRPPRQCLAATDPGLWPAPKGIDDFRPHQCVVPFEATALPAEEQETDHYVRIEEGAKGGRLRFVPLNTPQRTAALAFAQAVAGSEDAHLGNPLHSLKRNLRRFDSYVMARFGVTAHGLGATAHGLRHEALIDRYSQQRSPQAITAFAPLARIWVRQQDRETSPSPMEKLTKTSDCYPGAGPTSQGNFRMPLPAPYTGLSHLDIHHERRRTDLQPALSSLPRFDLPTLVRCRIGNRPARLEMGHVATRRMGVQAHIRPRLVSGRPAAGRKHRGPARAAR